jgi:hypothetical protein
MGQKNRMRGRNNNRRGPNPLTRSYESNGPDVKVRGTAAHVAEKYVQLARDAHSAGDVVMSESYLQHAEHYYRLIAAAQAQLQPQYGGQAQQPAEIDIMDDEDEFEVAGADRFTFRPPQAFQQQNGGMQGGYGQQPAPYGEATGQGEQPPVHGEQPFPPEQPQPRQDGRPDNRPYDNRPRDNRPDRPERQDRQERFGNRGPFGDRRDRFRDRDRDRGERRPGGEQPGFAAQRPPVPDPASEPQPELPSFITGGAPAFVRPAPVSEEPAEPAFAPEAAGAGEDAAGRPRRRRRSRPRFEGEATPAVEGAGEGE